MIPRLWNLDKTEIINYDNKVDIFGRYPISRGSRTKMKIYEFWNQHPLRNLLNWSNEQFLLDNRDNRNNNSGMFCMACGISSNQNSIERAHIMSVVEGGSNRENNMHNLCSNCHKDSEMLEGYSYWLWITLKSSLFHKGSDTPIMDGYDVNGQLVEFPLYNPTHYLEKVKKYSAEYSFLSSMLRWHPNQSKAKYMLENPKVWGFNIRPKNIEIIPIIDEHIVRFRPQTLEEEDFENAVLIIMGEEE